MNYRKINKKRSAYAVAIGTLTMDYIEQSLTHDSIKAENTKRAIEKLTTEWCAFLTRHVPKYKEEDKGAE